MTVPKRRKRERFGTRADDGPERNPRHARWVRGFECAVAGKVDECSGKIQFAHVRRGTDGGLGLKPSDAHGIPLCEYHHLDVQHVIGEAEFERRYAISMLEIANALYRRSPYRRKD